MNVPTIVFLACCAIVTKTQDNGDLVVEIATGQVKGRRAKTADSGKSYYAFQGIPYAEPPVGDLRFRAPVPAKRWTGLLTTQEDEHKCVQDIKTKGSEDCLYINVFTPNTESSELPVMVWIYGGSFIRGDSRIETFAPDYLLEEDVLVVTFNYRVGVFGFLSTEDEASPGNYALKDQILAIKWVHENINKFGGDPKQVTIFGESAGAASVAYLLQTPLTKGLFHRAIMQSGTSLNLWSLSRKPRKTAFAIGKVLDIDTQNSTVLMKALRKVDTRTLQAISLSTDLVQTVLSNPRDGLIFAPSVEPDTEGAVVTQRSHELLKFGDFNTVPCIVGFNSEEGLSYKNVIDNIRPYLFTYNILATRLIPIDLNIDSYFSRVIVGLLIKRRYFGMFGTEFSNEKLIQFVTDDQFIRAIHEYASLLAKYLPLYYYRFSYEGRLGVDGKSRETSGVGHGEDLNYIWRKESNIKDPSEADILTRRRLIKLWTNFAKTSNPTPQEDPLLQNISWHRSSYNRMTYLDIGNDLKLSSNLVQQYNIKFWKDLYTDFGVPPFDTY